MSDNHKLELLDQLDDAAFALMMDEYAEAEGERLQAEFEAAMAAGLVPPKPEGLDDKCRRLIKSEFGRAKWREYGSRARTVALKTAAVLLITLGVTGATVKSMQALRIPVRTFLMEHNSQYSKIVLDRSEITVSADTPPVHDLSDIRGSIAELIPEGYYEISCESHEGLVSAKYENEDFDYILFTMTGSSGEFQFDSREAQVSQITIGGYEATYVVEDRLHLIWCDEEQQIVYTLVSNGLTEAEFLDICTSLTAQTRQLRFL